MTGFGCGGVMGEKGVETHPSSPLGKSEFIGEFSRPVKASQHNLELILPLNKTKFRDDGSRFAQQGLRLVQDAYVSRHPRRLRTFKCH